MNGAAREEELAPPPPPPPDAAPLRSGPATAVRPASVSVIVRSMNRPTLVETLASVASQDYTSIEVVLVNAAGLVHAVVPTDCGDFPVISVAAPDGQALPRASAANLGLDVAKGSLLLFLDDDDILLPTHVSRLVAALHAHPHAPAAFADVEMGRYSDGRWLPLHRFEADFDAMRLYFENYLPIHGVLFRHTASASVAGFDEQFDLFEDWDFWLQLAGIGTFIHVPGVTARYCVGELAQSNVFADSPATRAARQRLFEKWQSRISLEQHCALLGRLQTLFREAPPLRAETALAQVTAANLQDIVEAREAELAQAAQMLAKIEQVMAERERELADSQAQRTQLLGVLAAREREVLDAHAHASGLEKILAAREHDASASVAHAAALSIQVLARERELSDSQVHVAGIQSILAARECELGNAVAHAAALEQILAERDREIADARTQIDALLARLGSDFASGEAEATRGEDRARPARAAKALAQKEKP